MQRQLSQVVQLKVPFGRIVPSANKIEKNKKCFGDDRQENGKDCDEAQREMSGYEKFVSREAVRDDVKPDQKDIEDEELCEDENVVHHGGILQARKWA